MNQNEFISLVSPFKEKVYRLAKRLLISREEAEDATQEILVKLWNKNSDLSTFKSLEAFAMTITKNYCLDQLKSKRAGNITLNDTDFKSNDSGLEKKVEDYDSLYWVERCIYKLPVQQRIIIQLRDIEQYEFEEMAKILDLSESTIRVSLSRARKEVRGFMIKAHNYGIK